MKKKMNNIAVLGIIFLLGVGYLIPTMIMELEDRELMLEKRSIEIDDIQLNSQNVDIMDKMAVFPDMLMNNIVVEVGEGIQEEAILGEQEYDYSGASQATTSELQKNVLEFLLMLDPKEEVELEKFYASNFAMMVAPNDERVYSIWECVGVDREGEEYHIWVDASTGKVLAFDIPFQMLGYTDERFYSAMDRVVSYYEINTYDLWAYSFAEGQSNLYKTKYWENGLSLLNKEGEEAVYLCIYKIDERLLFNVYPGALSISNKSEA